MKSRIFRFVSRIFFVLSFSTLLPACFSTNQTVNTIEDVEIMPSISFIPKVEQEEISDILDLLGDLPIDQFFEKSFLQMGLRYPEDLVEMGIDQELGVPWT